MCHRSPPECGRKPHTASRASCDRRTSLSLADGRHERFGGKAGRFDMRNAPGRFARCPSRKLRLRCTFSYPKHWLQKRGLLATKRRSDSTIRSLVTADRASQSTQDVVNEFEREPVPERARLGFKSFVGMYAGEHTAGTELMIGPLFVASGVSAFDLVVGLFVGNLLAVLSWTFMTAPIATRARLTLYYQLEKICGRGLVTLYNLANGVMFCFLAGAMITVSATASACGSISRCRSLTTSIPTAWAWVVAVVLLGVGDDRRGRVRLRFRGACGQHRRAVDDARLHRVWARGLRQFGDARRCGELWTPRRPSSGRVASRCPAR